MYKAVILLLLLYFRNEIAHGQSDWKFEAEKDGTKVYSKTVSDSKIKVLRAECILEATHAQIVALLLDIPATTKWLCHTKSCVLLEKISDNELVYYTEVNLPWPLYNRDFVTHMSIENDLVGKTVTVNTKAIAGRVAHKNNLVRVTKSEGAWIITPHGENKVKVSYTLQVDPGGYIPAWIVNSFAVQAPIESFTKMKELLKSGGYKTK